MNEFAEDKSVLAAPHVNFFEKRSELDIEHRRGRHTRLKTNRRLSRRPDGWVILYYVVDVACCMQPLCPAHRLRRGPSATIFRRRNHRPYAGRRNACRAESFELGPNPAVGVSRIAHRWWVAHAGIRIALLRQYRMGLTAEWRRRMATTLGAVCRRVKQAKTPQLLHLCLPQGLLH